MGLLLSKFRQRAALMGAALSATGLGLTGCYVVPIHQAPAHAPVALQAPAPPVPVTLSARLYPANDQATRLGLVHAVVTNDLHGRGTFNATVQGETFVGEATRKAGSSREGLASGTGSRGGYLSCQYTMNSATLGTGSCRLSNGALFTMHVGS